MTHLSGVDTMRTRLEVLPQQRREVDGGVRAIFDDTGLSNAAIVSNQCVSV
jgi:hypothetical protein